MGLESLSVCLLYGIAKCPHLGAFINKVLYLIGTASSGLVSEVAAILGGVH